MSTPPVDPRPPKCPYCKEPMPIVVLYPYQVGMLILPSIQCPWCAVLLHIELIRPQAEAPAKEDPEPPRVVLPS